MFKITPFKKPFAYHLLLLQITITVFTFCLTSLLLPIPCQASPRSSVPIITSRSDAGLPGYSVEDFVRELELKNSIELLAQPGVTFKKALVDTSLGDIAVRWPTSHTGFVPEQSVVAAAKAVEETLETLSFPYQVSSAPYGWNIVIQPGIPPGAKGRLLQSSDCHTAYMGPPADIVVNYDKLFSPCDASERDIGPDRILSHVLIHEIAHGIEFRLLGKGFSRRARWHSEGFALWIESLAVEALSSRSGPLLRDKFRSHARSNFNPAWRPWLFHGTGNDYANSYAMIAVVAETRGVPRLLQIYNEMDRSGLLFQEAASKVLGWDMERWIQEAREFMKEP